MLLTTVSRSQGAWKWAKNRRADRIITRPIGSTATDLRFKGVELVYEGNDYCTDYTGGQYGSKANELTDKDLAEHAKEASFEAISDLEFENMVKRAAA